jgi:hypothetical protein
MATKKPNSLDGEQMPVSMGDIADYLMMEPDEHLEIEVEGVEAMEVLVQAVRQKFTNPNTKVQVLTGPPGSWILMVPNGSTLRAIFKPAEVCENCRN